MNILAYVSAKGALPMGNRRAKLIVIMRLSLENFLENKPLYYKEIDHERVHSAYALLKPHIKHPKTVHIVGTNGKGSTGRMIAYLAYKGDLSIGHYSSPSYFEV